MTDKTLVTQAVDSIENFMNDLDEMEEKYTVANAPDTKEQILYKNLYKISKTKKLMNVELVYNPIQLHEIGLFMTYVNSALKNEIPEIKPSDNLKTLNDYFQNSLKYMNSISVLDDESLIEIKKLSSVKEKEALTAQLKQEKEFALHTSLFINPKANNYLFELIPLVFPEIVEAKKLKQEFLSEFVNFMCEEIGSLVESGMEK